MAFDDRSTRSMRMETDEDPLDSFYSNTNLRRWNSSPMINNNGEADSVYSTERPRRSGRTRTFSASMYYRLADSDSGLTNTITPIGSPGSRVSQLKQEESIDEMTREVLSERNVTSEIQLSQSWGGMSLMAEKSFDLTDERRVNNEEAGSAFSSPIASTSPIRISCEHRLSRARSLTPSPGPTPISPRCRTIRRSLSPNGLRPSVFMSKRKIDPDEDDASLVRQKKLCTQISLSSTSTCSSPDHNTFDSVNLSFDEDSGSDHSLSNNTASPGFSLLNVGNTAVFYCEGKNHNSYPFLKPKYVAPPSPLAAGMHNTMLQNDSKKTSIHGSNYTFTPVKD